jgi:hypothetical protein
METLVFLAVAFALAYVIVYTPVIKLLNFSPKLIRNGSVEKKTVETKKETSVSASDCQQPSIPEDSTLKRHFLSNLRASIESEFSPRPTCSTLSRHHDTLIAVEMDKRLKAA